LVIACHPVDSIEDPQVEGPAVASQRLLTLDVEVLFEVREGQLPHCPVEGLPKAEAHKIGLSHCTPKPVTSIESQQVLVVTVIGYKLEDERRIPESPQGGGRKESAVKTVGLTVPEDTKRRAVDLLDTVGDRIKKLLDPERPVQTANQL
jgi:hypothetical protein